MKERLRINHTVRYAILMVLFLLVVNLSLGYLLVQQSTSSTVSLMQTRMLDISNTAAAMIDGDALESITAEDQGTEAYETISNTLLYFQHNIDLKYIYCVYDRGNDNFVFGIDPSDDPGEFGSPVVYTEALKQASQGIPSVDREYYEDAWGKFYSAYSPVYNSRGEIAGIIAADFSAEWYNQQLSSLIRTTIIVCLISILIGGGIVTWLITRSEKKIGALHGQLDSLAASLMQEMGSTPAEGERAKEREQGGSIAELEKQIQSMQTELKTQIAHVHGQAYRDGLTGVKNRQAYLDAEKTLDKQLKEGTLTEFAIVLCDVNGLKQVNDTQGHHAGDEYLRKACGMICEIFSHSPVYRLGGDEFVVVLTGRDYENRDVLMHELHRRSAVHIATQEAIVSGGMTEYVPGQDHSVQEVFERADATMYEEKMLLKSLGATTREEESLREIPAEELPEIHTRKHLLIADDVEDNREILGELLEDDYDIYYASDGAETLDMLRGHADEIALVLLDLYMPRMSGRDVLTEMQVDEELMSIPVIMLTVDREAELECLKIGAMDFISKPYPDIEIIKARISKCIELSETRDLIRQTQRDKLTGLYNIDYFVRYVDEYDRQYSSVSFDALVCDINDFYGVNEQYGRHFGDLVLRSIGNSMRKLARKTGGICCRKGGDTFLLYCPHREDYETLLRKFTEGLFVEKETAKKVSLRFGVYTNAERELEVEERFDRARSAADSVRNDPVNICGSYR